MSAKKELTARYQQNILLKGEHRFEIFNRRFLRIHQQQKKKQQQYALDMVVLNPEACRIEHYTWHWLTACGISSLLFLIFVGLMVYEFTLDTAIYLLPLSVLSLWLALIFGLMFFLTSERKQVFSTRYGQVPIAEFQEGKSEPLPLQQFVQAMQASIKHCTAKADFSSQELRAGELKTLRRLVSEGAISEAAYEEAKGRILT